MKYLVFFIFLLTSNICFSQSEYFGYEIIFDKPNPQLDQMTPDSSKYFTEKHYYFERITQYYDENTYMFSSEHPTGMILKRAYESLVNTFGVEDINGDYIPEENKNELTYEDLVELCLSRKAEIYRAWKSHPDFDIALGVIADGLSVQFKKK